MKSLGLQFSHYNSQKMKIFLLAETKSNTFFCFRKHLHIFFQVRKQTKELIFTCENKTTFSFAWDNKNVYIVLICPK